MIYILVAVSSGIISGATFFTDISLAASALAEFVKGMNPQNDDVGLYGPCGLIANAKSFLDEQDQFVENSQEIIERISTYGNGKPVYLIGNPTHDLGFMVASYDDPLGFTDPAAAISELGLMRMDHGCHLKLYQVIPVSGPVTTIDDVEKLNADSWVDEFHAELVREYLYEPILKRGNE